MDKNERTTRLVAIVLTLLLAFVWQIFDPHDHRERRESANAADVDHASSESQGVYIWNLRFVRGKASVPVADLDVSISVPGRRALGLRTDAQGRCRIFAVRLDDGLSSVSFADPNSGATQRRIWLGCQIDTEAETIIRIDDPEDLVPLWLRLHDGSAPITRLTMTTTSHHASPERRRRVLWTVADDAPPSELVDLGGHSPGSRGEVEIEWRCHAIDRRDGRRHVRWRIDDEGSISISDPSVRPFAAPVGRGVVLDVDLSATRRMEGRIIDEDGRPVAGRWCAFLEPEGTLHEDEHSDFGAARVWQETDAQGRFWFDAEQCDRREEWEYAGTLLIVNLGRDRKSVERVRVCGSGPVECVVER